MLTPKGNKYELTKDYTYKDVVVPKGFTTDGITYKLRIVGLFINKFDPKYITAAIVHDYLTDNDEWEVANEYFEEMLPKGFRSSCMVLGVKAYRWFKGK